MTIMGLVTGPVLTTPQAAERIGKSPRQTRRLAAQGKLPGAIKLPGHTGAYIFDADVFEAYLTGRRVLGGYPDREPVAS
jgi:muconolactone delta-isomerase